MHAIREVLQGIGEKIGIPRNYTPAPFYEEVRAPIEISEDTAAKTSIREAGKALVQDIAQKHKEYPHPLGGLFKAALKKEGRVPLRLANRITPPNIDAATLAIKNIVHFEAEEGMVVVDPLIED